MTTVAAQKNIHRKVDFDIEEQYLLRPASPRVVITRLLASSDYDGYQTDNDAEDNTDDRNARFVSFRRNGGGLGR